MDSVPASAADPTLELEQLMVGYQQADPIATATLIQQLSPLLYRFFASQLGSWTEAEDLLQDAWLRIHKARHTYRPGEPVMPWIYAIARHVRVDGYRRRQRTRAREQDLESVPDPVAPEQKAEPEGPTFDKMVGSLPESQREVLTMLKVNGMSLEEVALATASTVGSVKQKAHRAYQKLRQTLASSSGKAAVLEQRNAL